MEMEKPELPKALLLPELKDENLDSAMESMISVQDHIDIVQAYLESVKSYKGRLALWHTRSKSGADGGDEGRDQEEETPSTDAETVLGHRTPGPHSHHHRRRRSTGQQILKSLNELYKMGLLFNSEPPKPAESLTESETKEPATDSQSEETETEPSTEASDPLSRIGRVTFTLAASDKQSTLRIDFEGDALEKKLEELDLERARMELDRERNVIRFTDETQRLPHPSPTVMPFPAGAEIPPIARVEVEVVRGERAALVISVTKEEPSEEKDEEEAVGTWGYCVIQ